MNKLALRRLLALFIDYIVVVGWIAVITGVSAALFLGTSSGYPNVLGMFGPFGAELIFFTILTLPIGVYLYVMESGRKHATFGKRVAKIQVANVGRGAVSRKQIFVRTVVKLLPWEFAHMLIWQLQYFFYVHGYQADVPGWIITGLIIANVIPLIYLYLALFSKDGRSVHDLLAKTVVEAV
jgi:uncharacterized RDD family membrane protein YckC